MKPGDKVRLRDGAHLWIAQRDGWTVGSTDDKTSSAIVKRDDAAICIHQDDIEPESPPIPPEPKRVVGQAWLDADGGLVQTDNAEGSSLAYILTGTESVVCWQDLAHPLTPLYPVPDPNDGEAVEALSSVVYNAQRGQYRSDITWSVRAVLRSLRGDA